MKRALTILLSSLVCVSLAASAFAAPKQLTVRSADGTALACTVQGSGKPALVFVHGWCCDRSYWKNQLPFFETKYTVVTLDLGGHGDSGLARPAWTIDAFGADVAAVVKALELEEVILIGHSMGGEVDLEAARLLPGKVIGLIGVDTYQDFGMKTPPEQRDGYLAAFKADFPGMTSRFVRSMFTDGADSALVSRVASDMSAGPAEVGVGAMESVMNYDPAPALGDLRIPIRCINSDRWPTNVEGNRKLAHSFDVKFMTGRGHFVQLEDPETFNRLLDETIREIVKGE